MEPSVSIVVTWNLEENYSNLTKSVAFDNNNNFLHCAHAWNCKQRLNFIIKLLEWN